MFLPASARSHHFHSLLKLTIQFEKDQTVQCQTEESSYRALRKGLFPPAFERAVADSSLQIQIDYRSLEIEFCCIMHEHYTCIIHHCYVKTETNAFWKHAKGMKGCRVRKLGEWLYVLLLCIDNRFMDGSSRTFLRKKSMTSVVHHRALWRNG